MPVIAIRKQRVKTNTLKGLFFFLSNREQKETKKKGGEKKRRKKKTETGRKVLYRYYIEKGARLD